MEHIDKSNSLLKPETREEQKHLFHREKPSVPFFALLSMKKKILFSFAITEAIASSSLTSLGAATVLFKQLPVVPHRTLIDPNHCGSATST